ncbi:MAG: nickel/cobalt transporter [Pseudomonadota bacterium]
MSIAGTTTLAIAATLMLLAGMAAVLMPYDNELATSSGLLLEIQAVQRDLHRELAAAMQAVGARGAEAGYALVGLSFLYGVFHAAGPGHGKIVISTYLLTQESQLRRGLLLSLVASLCQGFTAIAVVAAVAGALDLTLRQTTGTANGLETLSYALVAVVGLALIASRMRRLLRPRVHDHAHGDDGVTSHVPRRAGAVGDDTDQVGCSSCGHSHGPGLSDLEAPLSWHGLAGIIASVGVRPCSGAILVLLVAFSLDLRLAGAVAVLAMSLGTAITVSILAVLSVYARNGAIRVAALFPNSSKGLSAAVDLVAVLGGAVILLTGLLMLQADLTASTHPLR